MGDIENGDPYARLPVLPFPYRHSFAFVKSDNSLVLDRQVSVTVEMREVKS